MENQLDVLRDVSTRLSQAGIAYMLTGSLAMNFYAHPRMTRDIDLVVELEPRDVDRIIALFEPDYFLPRDALKRVIEHRTLFNILHTKAIVKVDFIIRKDSHYRAIEFDRRRLVELHKMQVWIVSKEDLIISKLCWAKDSHSDSQLRDVRNLLKTGYDAVYVSEWTAVLGLTELLNECLQNE